MFPSLAHSFFERITQDTDPVAAIRRLINSDPPTIETDWLDFKTEHHDARQRDKKVRETWSEALGGFANNQGGVLIWGVDARKVKVGGAEIDAACDEKPITDPQALRSRLVELHRGATDPPLANVEIKAYELPGNPGKGFVICYVPQGLYRPYRAEQAGQQFYIRAGDNFVVMGRSMLQAMFYPRTQAVFRVRSSLSWAPEERQLTGGRHIASLTCHTDLVNDGTATAKDTFVLVKANAGLNLREIHFKLTGWDVVNSDPDIECLSPRPLHPNRVTPLFVAKWNVEAGSSPTDSRVLPKCSAPCFDLAIFCENQERQLIKVEFDMEELIEKNTCFREATPIE
jgi:hypothetical protein